MLKSELIDKYKNKWNDACFAAKQLKLSRKYSSMRIEQGKKLAYAEIIDDLEKFSVTYPDRLCHA